MFTKSDLKTGMMIKTVGGDRYIIMLNADVLGDIAYNIETKTYFGLDSYEEDMTDEPFFEVWNVAKVYDGISILCNTDDDIEGRLIWERKEEKVFDMSDSKATLREGELIFTDGVMDTVLCDGCIDWFVDALTRFFDGGGFFCRWFYNSNKISIHKEGIQLLVDGIGMLIDYPNARNLLTWLKDNKDE